MAVQTSRSIRVPWPGGNAARGGGGATRLSSRSSFALDAVGGASIGLDATTADAALTLDTLMIELPVMNRPERGRSVDKEEMNRSLQLEAIGRNRTGW